MPLDLPSIATSPHRFVLLVNINLPTSLLGGIKSNLNLREEVFRFQSKS